MADVRRADLERLIGGVLLLLVSGAFAAPGRVGTIEKALFRSVNGLPGSLYGPLWLVMQMGQLLAIPGTAVAALVWRRERLALELTMSGLSAYLLAKVIKTGIKRGRPEALLGSVSLRGAHAGDHGFVSGHTADALALAGAAVPYFGTRGRAIIWALPALVGGARIYVGAHLPLDVSGGAGLGFACAAAVHLLLGNGPHCPGRRNGAGGDA